MEAIPLFSLNKTNETLSQGKYVNYIANLHEVTYFMVYQACVNWMKDNAKA